MRPISKRSLAIYLFLFSLVWTTRILFFVQFEQPLTSESLRAIYSAIFKLAFWALPPFVYLKAHQVKQPSKQLGFTANSNILNWCLAIIGFGIVWKTALITIGIDDLPLVTWRVVLLAVISSALAEETLFRGLILPQLGNYLTKLKTNLLTSLGFLLIHFPGWLIISHRSLDLDLLYDTFYIFGISLVFGWLRQKTDSLWPSIVLHAVNNLISMS